MRSALRLSILALVAAAAAPLHAQATNTSIATDSSRIALEVPTELALPAVTAPAPAAGPVATVPQAGAAVTGLRAGVHAAERARTAAALAVPANAHLGQDRAMMIVGAAALVVGGIIGGTPGTLIMVGGGVIGLYGLYNYLQ